MFGHWSDRQKADEGVTVTLGHKPLAEAFILGGQLPSLVAVGSALEVL